MGFLSRLLGPNHSIILRPDPLSLQDSMELRDQVAEIKQYYRFAPLSELVGPKRNAKGIAAIVFPSARKSVFLHAVPFLLSEEIPFALFLEPDCIGLNRLPLVEEMRAYEAGYPAKKLPKDWPSWKEKVWEEPAQVEQFLRECRRTVGPLPIQQLDPTHFFATWGKINEVPPRLLELGLVLHSASSINQDLATSLRFVEHQAKRRPRFVSAPRELTTEEIFRLEREGISGAMTMREGEVLPNTSRWDLPNWPLKPAPGGE